MGLVLRKVRGFQSLSIVLLVAVAVVLFPKKSIARSPSVFSCIFENVKDEDDVLALDIVRLTQYAGEVRGNIGKQAVTVHQGSDVISFMEVLTTGVVHTTAVYLNIRHEDKMYAVHSRHTLIKMGGREVPAPSQMIGFCTEGMVK